MNTIHHFFEVLIQCNIHLLKLLIHCIDHVLEALIHCELASAQPVESSDGPGPGPQAGISTLEHW